MVNPKYQCKEDICIINLIITFLKENYIHRLISNAVFKQGILVCIVKVSIYLNATDGHVNNVKLFSIFVISNQMVNPKNHYRDDGITMTKFDILF